MKIRRSISKEWILPLFILFLVCLVTVGSSPVFKTNSWVDSNAMLTMGRALVHGQVPYRDIIDQRGPVLYALFALGSLIKNNSFFGVFILQLFNIGLVYFLPWKMALDFKIEVVDAKWAALLGPLALISTNTYNLSGSPEEFVFSLILYLLYVINHYHQRVTDIPLKTYFILGFSLSLIFWNKYSLAGVYIVFFLWVAISLLMRRDFHKLSRIVLASVLGFSIITLLVLIYFAVTHALGDMFQIYFLQNMTAYGSTKQSQLMKFLNLFFIIGRELQSHYFVIILIVAGWLKAVYEKKNVLLEVSLFGGALLFVALQRWLNDYNNLIWMPFLAVALLRLLQIKTFKLAYSDKAIFYTVNVLIVGCLLVLPFANNSFLSQLVPKGSQESNSSQSFTAQPQFASRMVQETKGKPTLLMINDLDEGFYLAAHTLPTTRYWQKLNMNYDQLPAMYQSFAKTMNHQKIDYVIVKLMSPPENGPKALNQQISGAVDRSIYPSLMNNYRIDSMAQNSPNEFYILFCKK